MKTLFFVFAFAFLVVACSRGPRVPCVCQRNLQDCRAAYDGVMSHSEWNRLCREDLKVCESGYGM